MKILARVIRGTFGRSVGSAAVAAVVVGSGTGMLPGTVLAQDESLEEVVVTATRRAETDIQTTPVAVTPISGGDFEKMFAQDIGEIAMFVPNFSAATITGFNAASFAMRGAGETDIIVYFDPKVGVIVDDFVVPHVQTQLLEPFDIEAIEVLRGPQGTLFGKNTTAGAVVVRTKRPEFDRSTVEGSIQYGDYNDMKVRFAANTPLSDTLAFRFAGIYHTNDGFYQNGKVDNPIDAFGLGIGDAGQTDGTAVAGDGRDLGGKDVFSSRAKLLWQPNDRFQAFAQLEFIRDSSDPVPVVNVTPANSPQLAGIFGFPGVSSGDPLDQAGIHRSAVVGLNGDQTVDVFGAYLNTEYTMTEHTWYTHLGYREQESRLPNEYLGTAYESFFAASRDDDRETFQFETRIASDKSGPINYVGGVFYQTNDTEFCVLQQLGLLEFFGTAVPGVLDNQNPLLLCNAQDATSFAVFGDLTWDVSEKFQIGIGARWTDEEKDYIAREGLPTAILFPGGQFNEPLDGQDFTLGQQFVQTDSESWDEPTWRITGSYEFNADLFGYLTFSRGFKSGGYNDQAGSGGFAAFPVASYDPEFANNIELGIRSSFMEDRVRLNATVFDVEYEDFQRSTVVSLPDTGLQETRTFNAAQVSAKGLELELTALLSSNVTVRANLGLLDATYDEFLLDRNNDGVLEDFSGRDVVRAPDVTAGIDVTYMQDISSGTLRWNANFNYEDENTYYYADDIGQEFDTVLEKRTILNASVTWSSTDNRYFASIFGKNLTDDRYKTAAQSVGVLWTFASYGPPRMFGVEAGFRFGN